MNKSCGIDDIPTEIVEEVSVVTLIRKLFMHSFNTGISIIVSLLWCYCSCPEGSRQSPIRSSKLLENYVIIVSE